MAIEQLPLMIPPKAGFEDARFLLSKSNRVARTWLDRTDAWPDSRLALWGEADSGKTHLLHIWAKNREAELIDGASLSGFPDVISPGGVAVDDAERADEAALLHLLNTARDLSRPVLLASRRPPSRWPVSLQDLASRLRAVTPVEIGIPDDALMRRLLLHFLAERGLEAAETLHHRLLLRLPRSPEILRLAVARLDQDSLALRRRKVTPAMVSAALNMFAEDDDLTNLSSSPPPGPSPVSGGSR
jgi:chromosomal replication initiation ATPase DnaA